LTVFIKFKKPCVVENEKWKCLMIQYAYCDLKTVAGRNRKKKTEPAKKSCAVGEIKKEIMSRDAILVFDTTTNSDDGSSLPWENDGHCQRSPSDRCSTSDQSPGQTVASLTHPLAAGTGAAYLPTRLGEGKPLATK